MKSADKSAEETYNEVAATMAEHGTQISKMFGMPSLKIKDKAFAGFANDSMIFKLTGDAHRRALSEPGSKLFEPMKGRPMKEWVEVPHTSSQKWLTLAEAARDYCATLPKK